MDEAAISQLPLAAKAAVRSIDSLPGGTRLTSGRQTTSGLFGTKHSWVTTDSHLDGWVLIASPEEGTSFYSSFGWQGSESGYVVVLDPDGELLLGRYNLSKREPIGVQTTRSGDSVIYENTDFLNLGELSWIDDLEPLAESWLRMPFRRGEYLTMSPSAGENWRYELGAWRTTGTDWADEVLTALTRFVREGRYHSTLSIRL